MRTIKLFAHRVARACGMDFARYNAANCAALRRAALLRERHVELALDVGANVGSYGEELRAHGFAGEILSFEPLAGAYERLAARAGADGNWRACRTAVGRAAGEAVLNVSGRDTSSSMLPMNAAHTAVAAESGYVSRETVPVDRVDALAARLSGNSGACLLKADVQGFELEVLEGAANILPRVQLIEIELSFVPLYQGAPSLARMLEYLEHRSFFPVSIDPVVTNPRNGCVLQVNAIFARVSPGKGGEPDFVRSLNLGS